jgi:putative mRNA 3-end processing factor
MFQEVDKMRTRVGWRNGVTIKLMKDSIHFDPTKKTKIEGPFFISHAHSDHLKGIGSTGTGYVTNGTMDILSSRGYKRIDRFRQIQYENSVKVDSLEIIAHNAGHMLGSAQYEIRGPESKILYTGDINYQDMLTTKAAEPIPSDVLIIEATYGHPRYVFPKLMETCMNLVDWTIAEVQRKKLPVFKVYSAGKAQEVIKILNSFTALPVVTHPKITDVCKAYVKNGIKLTYVDANKSEGEELLRGRECVFITTSYSKIPSFNECSLATATGWAVQFKMKKVNAAFPLSSHADFNQLVQYVKASKPTCVYTVYGFKEVFATYLSKTLGLKARPLSYRDQTVLSEFISIRE